MAKKSIVRSTQALADCRALVARSAQDKIDQIYSNLSKRQKRDSSAKFSAEEVEKLAELRKTRNAYDDEAERLFFRAEVHGNPILTIE